MCVVDGAVAVVAASMEGHVISCMCTLLKLKIFLVSVDFLSFFPPTRNKLSSSNLPTLHCADISSRLFSVPCFYGHFFTPEP